MSMGTNFISKQPSQSLETSDRNSQFLQDPNSKYSVVFETPNMSTIQDPENSNNRSVTVARFGVGFASNLSEHVLSHPYIVIRRQSQVNHGSRWYHLTPFTLFHTIYNIQSHQSLTTLWKGIGSTLMVKGIGVATESAVSELTPLPKEVSRHSSIKKIAGHLLLKSISFVVITPFYAASLVETVQSEIASESPGVFDCIKEGINRIMTMSSPPATRLLPVWKLFFPTVLHGVMHYIICSLARYTVILSMKSDDVSRLQSKEDPLNTSQQQSNVSSTFYPELVATFTGSLLADIMLYPLEAILHRLCMQGTRTIIDNTDTGLGVVPIITRYEGVIDCFKEIITEEGVSGLYKGFGALVLQYGMHILILRVTKLVLDTLSNKDSNASMLASELSERQLSQMSSATSIRPSPRTSATNVDSPYQKQHRMTYKPEYGYVKEDISNMSFNFNSSYATSTPYDTPLQGKEGLTGPGSTGLI